MKIFHMPVRKRRQKGLRVSGFALLWVVFKWHHGSEVVKPKSCWVYCYQFMISLNVKAVGFTAVKDTRVNRMTKLIALKWLLIAAVKDEESRLHRLFSIQPLFVWPLYSPGHTASCRVIVLSRKYGPFLRIFMRSGYQGNEVSKGVLGYVLTRADSYWARSPRATKSKRWLNCLSSSSSSSSSSPPLHSLSQS